MLLVKHITQGPAKSNPIIKESFKYLYGFVAVADDAAGDIAAAEDDIDVII